MNTLVISLVFFIASVLMVFMLSWIGIWSNSKLRHLIIPLNITYVIMTFFALSHIYGSPKPLFPIIFWNDIPKGAEIEFTRIEEDYIYFAFDINNKPRMYAFPTTPELVAKIRKKQKENAVMSSDEINFDSEENRESAKSPNVGYKKPQYGLKASPSPHGEDDPNQLFDLDNQQRKEKRDE